MLARPLYAISILLTLFIFKETNYIVQYFFKLNILGVIIYILVFL